MTKDKYTLNSDKENHSIHSVRRIFNELSNFFPNIDFSLSHSDTETSIIIEDEFGSNHSIALNSVLKVDDAIHECILAVKECLKLYGA